MYEATDTIGNYAMCLCTRFGWVTALPVLGERISARAIVRENRKTPLLPYDIAIQEFKAESDGTDVTLDFEYDEDKVYS